MHSHVLVIHQTRPGVTYPGAWCDLMGTRTCEGRPYLRFVRSSLTTLVHSIVASGCRCGFQLASHVNFCCRGVNASRLPMLAMSFAAIEAKRFFLSCFVQKLDVPNLCKSAIRADWKPKGQTAGWDRKRLPRDRCVHNQVLMAQSPSMPVDTNRL